MTAVAPSKASAPLLKKKDKPSEEELVLAEKKQNQKLKQFERERRLDFQKKQRAARTIQIHWRKHRRDLMVRKKKKSSEFVATAQKAVRVRRLQTSEEEWEKQIAALTIQLAWRKFFRRKLLQQLHPNRKQLQMWDPEVVAVKQQAMVNEIYSEVINAPFWHPTLKRPIRPFWLKFIPSPAVLSFNFALDKYNPTSSVKGGQPQLYLDGPDSQRSRSWHVDDDTDSFQGVKVSKSGKTTRFSYNLSDL